MILSSGVTKALWGDVVTTAGFLINRSPSAPLKFKTPEEIWSGKPPDLTQLKVFGCLAMAHVKRDKLGTRAMKCIFLGYPKGVKGYKLWCIEPGEKGALVSRDVVFNEHVMPLK